MNTKTTSFDIPKREPFFITEGCGDSIREQWDNLKPGLKIKCDDLEIRLSEFRNQPTIIMAKDYKPFLKEIRSIEKALEPFTVRLYLSLKCYESMENLPRVPCDVAKIKAVKREVFEFKSNYQFLKHYSD